MRLALLSLASLAVLGANANVHAQGVPYGDYIFSFCNSTSTWPEGLGLNDGPGGSTCKPVTGLGATGLSINVNALQIDPCNDSIWLGFCDNDTLANITITAAGGRCAVASGTSWGSATGTPGTGQIINKICFDFNCQPLAASGNDVWRFDRHNPGNGVSIATMAGTVQALCCDANNLYIGVPGLGIYQAPRVPGACAYGTPALLCATTANITGCAICPSSGDVWFTSTALGSSSVATCSAAGGGVATSTKPGNIGPQNDITYDVRRNDFQIVNFGAGTAADNISQIDKNFCVTPVCTLTQPAGSQVVLTGTDTDDCVVAMTGISPNCGVLGTGAFTMDIWTCCNPGDFYGIFLVAPALATISTGVVGPSGKVCLTFRGLTMPAGAAPFSLVFQSACSDPNFALPIVFGLPTLWPGI